MAGTTGMAPMMRMMEMMNGPGPFIMGSPVTDHVEGRIAFLRAELKITEAQANSWNALSDALRANAKRLGDARQSVMKPDKAPMTFAESLDVQERWLSARLDGTRAIKTAYTALFAKLSDEQRKFANELLAPPHDMGMMDMRRMGSPTQ